MKKEIADRWVAALRSGEYQQGRQALRDHKNSYCCLGVLCELATGDGVIAARHHDSTCSDHDGFNDFPTDTVKHWSGMKSTTGSLDGFEKLHTLNDDRKWTFAEIADHIEKHWEKL